MSAKGCARRGNLLADNEQSAATFWRHPRSALLAGLALAVAVASAPLILAADADWVVVWSDGCMLLIVATTALKCFATARRLQGQEKTAWLFISVAYLFYALAHTTWSIYGLILGDLNPIATTADLGYLIAPLLLMAGIWIYRTGTPTLSTSIVELGNTAILLATIYLANTIIFQHQLAPLVSPIEVEILIAYSTVAMAAFVFALFNICFYMRGSRRFVMMPLLLALGSLASTDFFTILDFATARFTSASIANIGYFTTFALGYWAAFEQDCLEQNPTREQDLQGFDEAARRWETLLLPLAMMGLMAVAATHRANLTPDIVPHAAGALLLFTAAIAMRDWWSQRIAAQLRDKMRKATESLEDSERRLLAKNEELEAANRELSKEMFARLQVQEELRHAQKMEAIGQLTGGVAHDFNNLLAVIVANLDLLEQSLDAASPQEIYTQEATAAAHRGAALTERLLAFSRKQALDPRPTGVNVLLKSMKGLLERTLGETIQLRFELSADIATCMVDRAQLENAILNLVLNARDAMHSRGSITIEASNVTLDARDAAELPDATAGDYVSIAVRDTGMGMSAQVKQRVFEPFFTTKELGAGSGLGLSMVYGFAKQSEGHVSIESEVGSGTEVRLFIPQTDLLPDPIEGIDLDAAPTGQRESVLLVEDDPALRKMIATFLEKQNYQVAAAPDGSKALALLDERGPFDLLLSDVILPGDFSGPELAIEITGRQPSMKVLLMSGYASNALEGKTSPAKYANFLQKPFGMGTLAKEMRSVLDAEAEADSDPD